MSLRVTLQIYSGRRDPEWLVSGLLESQLRNALDGLKSGPQWEPPQRLGYRGIRIEQDSPSKHWLCVKGQIMRQDDAGTHWLADPECTIEALALESGRPVLDPTTLDHLIKMLTDAH